MPLRLVSFSSGGNLTRLCTQCHSSVWPLTGKEKEGIIYDKVLSGRERLINRQGLRRLFFISDELLFVLVIQNAEIRCPQEIRITEVAP